ncbi:site-specific integrase [Hansschlegelia sp.]|uniref:tyrosine-type recombinase/integrase n=1 Tax=Hansschlegelia sp. TaxID=2041892 RepID=UPI002BE0E463|nr:site-specific integrase [Hansschlegelia sp.]HVI30417.1 site-specific integrase [Hansschlegelia sp.]
MTLAEAAFRYEEELEHQPSIDDTRTSLGHLCRLIGGETPLVTIDGQMIANAARKRAAERVTIKTRTGLKEHGLVSAATVNRQIVQCARRLLIRAKQAWKVPVDTDIDWKSMLLPERQRMRVLNDSERAAYLEAFREDLRPIMRVYLLSGVRRSALCKLPRSAVDWEKDGFTIMLKRKRGEEPRAHFITFTPEIRAIFKAEMLKHALPEVFTYVVQQTRTVGGEKRVKGSRQPIGYDTLRKAHEAARLKAGIPEFRFHDNRHDTATRALRATKNLKLVQRMLGHSDISSTARYAHVLDDDLREGMASFGLSRNSPEAPDSRLPEITRKSQENEG